MTARMVHDSPDAENGCGVGDGESACGSAAGAIRVKQSSGRAGSSMRLIRNMSRKEARAELERVGVDPYGISAMLPKLEQYCIMVENLPCPIANIMKQEMLSLGGDVAVARGSVACSIDRTDALIMGTGKQVDRFIEKLARQPFGSRGIAEDLRALIDRSSTDRFELRTPQRTITIGGRTLIMAILNMTPDSFSDGGCYSSCDEAVEAALRMKEDGADIIDVGGESTRPGAEAVTMEEERERVVPLIRALKKRVDLPLSIDTTKAGVAQAAVDEGAEIINDISALQFDGDMASVAAACSVPVILMHMRGTPRTMQTGDLAYDSLEGEIIRFLQERIDAARSAGIDENALIVDPGIGFGKTGADNCRIIRHLVDFRCLGRPVLVGPSRKSFIGAVTGGTPENRLEGTAAAVTAAILAGAHIVRIHDTASMKRVAAMADSIAGGGPKP